MISYRGKCKIKKKKKHSNNSVTVRARGSMKVVGFKDGRVSRRERETIVPFMLLTRCIVLGLIDLPCLPVKEENDNLL